LSGNSLSTSLPDEPMMWLFFLVFLFVAAHEPGRLPRWYFNSPLTIIIGLQLVWLLVSVAFSQVFVLSAKFLLAKSWYLVCFYLLPVMIFKTAKDLKIAFWAFCIPLLATVLIITFRHSAFGFSFVSINGAIGKLYYNHVEYASVVSMFFPLIFTGFLLIGRRQILFKTLALLMVLFFAAVVFLTYARAAVLGVVFAAVVAIAVRLKLVNFVMPLVYILVAGIIYFLASGNKYMEYTPDYEHTYMRKNLAEHIRATFQGQDISSMERVYRWIAAVRMSDEHPVVGYGPHGFIEHYKSHTVPAFQTYVSNNPERSTTHNYFLLMLTEQGWPAMLLYAILIPVAFAQAQRAYHRFQSRFYKLCTLGLAMMIAVCFINNFFSELIETHKVGAMFYLGLSLLAILSYKSKLQQQEIS
jgi:O-antigen ligase